MCMSFCTIGLLCNALLVQKTSNVYASGRVMKDRLRLNNGTFPSMAVELTNEACGQTGKYKRTHRKLIASPQKCHARRRPEWI